MRLGISKLQFFTQKISNIFFSSKFLNIKTLEPEPYRYSEKMLDPDPDSMNESGFETLSDPSFTINHYACQLPFSLVKLRHSHTG
jgi:hypothetical protein